jgi:hypothetical protein
VSPSFRRAAGAALLGVFLAGCFSVDHFPGDASRYDGLYFGPSGGTPLEPAVDDSAWRNYALYGLFPWDEASTQFAGRRLSQIDRDRRPMRFVVTSEQTFVNGLALWGLSTLTAGLAPLVFVPRSIAVAAWR